MINSSQSVASLVLDHSECAEVFQRHRIDFCCKGQLSLEEAARQRGTNLDELVAQLERAIESRRGEREADPRELPTPRLTAMIVARHHEYLRGALPFVRQLAAKVGRVHGDHNPKLVDLDCAVGELTEAMVTHLDEEEQSLFPALAAKELDGALRSKLDAMAEEHLVVAKLLERIRNSADDFSLPEWACTSYRTLFSELRTLESDTMTHVHLENHVLMPRFVAANG